MSNAGFNEICLNCMEPLGPDGACRNCGDGTQPVQQPAHCLPAGTVLSGRYLVGRVLGQGGFGITYIGRDLTLDMRIAIKEYYPSPYISRNCESSLVLVPIGAEAQTRVRDGRRKFLSEARALAKFHDNPGIVDVRDFFEENGTAYIVMDYLDGETLKSHLQGSTLSANKAFELMMPILDALEKVHAEQVIHRDISPDNIMLRSDGSLCLMDFGAAHDMDYGDERSVSMVLKSGYAPEEQYRAKGKLGPWTDIYALCATLYRAIAGVAPDESLQRMISDEMSWPSEMGVEISPVQESVLKKGMAPRQADRYQSVAEMKQDLARLEEAEKAESETSPANAGPHNGIEPEAALATAANASASASETLRETAANGSADANTNQDTNAAADTSAAANAGAATETQTHPGKPRNRRRAAAIIAAAVVVIAAAIALFLLAPAYTVSFDTGDGSPLDPVKVSRTGTVAEPAAPSRHGYSFDGWYTDAALTDKAEFPLSPQSDITLYAAWDKTLASYTVSFVDAADGSQIADSKTIPEADVGSTVHEEAPDIAGYALESGKEAELVVSDDDARNIIEFRYRKLVPYTVFYRERGSETEVAPAKTVEGAVEGSQVSEEAPGISGYTISSASPQSITVGRDAQANAITFYYDRVQQPTYTYTPATSGGNSNRGGNTGGNTSSNAGAGDVQWAN